MHLTAIILESDLSYFTMVNLSRVIFNSVLDDSVVAQHRLNRIRIQSRTPTPISKVGFLNARFYSFIHRWFDGAVVTLTR